MLIRAARLRVARVASSGSGNVIWRRLRSAVSRVRVRHLGSRTSVHLHKN